ncbi:MAG: hypothetical protein PHX87_00930 [Candidatus Peribacteraceae bacterium]|nr:hypothetical protein [Candidatus Peribacteraceae bacterium]MDD5741973.1 hypothetical protein [Candidatus Peribacteraceae bacterium]
MIIRTLPCVYAAIDLDHKIVLDREKIYYEPLDGYLAPEFESGARTITQSFPQHHLGFGHSCTEVPGVEDFPSPPLSSCFLVLHKGPERS